MTSAASARLLAAVFAAGSLTVGFGAIDLLSPWILHEGTQVTDVGYGTLAGLVIPIGLIAYAWRPAANAAGLQQVALAAVAYLIAGALTAQPPLVAAGALLAAVALTVAALPSGRRTLLRRPHRPSLPLFGLTLLAAAPGSHYALHMAFNQRNDVLPADAHLGLGEWAALSAATIAALLAALLASLRTPGFTIPGLTAAAAVLVWAAACLTYPHSAGALRPTSAGVAIAWAVTFAAITVHEARKSSTPQSDSPFQPHGVSKQREPRQLIDQKHRRQRAERSSARRDQEPTQLLDKEYPTHASRSGASPDARLGTSIRSPLFGSDCSGGRSC